MTQNIQGKISLVVTTYLAVNHLALVMRSLADLRERVEQIVIVGDGSRESTRELIDDFRNQITVPVVFCWQPDKGFRLARSRNLGLLKITSRWVIYLDGDCMIPSDFIDRVKSLLEPNSLIVGSRKLLSEYSTQCLFELNNSKPERVRLQPFFSGRKFWSVPLGFLRIWPGRGAKSVRGFLMIFEAEMAKLIGGFDETFWHSFTNYWIRTSTIVILARTCLL